MLHADLIDPADFFVPRLVISHDYMVNTLKGILNASLLWMSVETFQWQKAHHSHRHPLST